MAVKRKHEVVGKAKDAGTSPSKQMKVGEEAAQAGQEEPPSLFTDAFWKELEGGDAGAEEAAQAPTGLVAHSPGQWGVPEDRCNELLRKAEAIAKRSGASLNLSGTLLRISGTPEEKKAAQHYGNLVADGLIIDPMKGASEEVTAFPVSEEWASAWRDQEATIEKEMDVLILFEEAKAHTNERWLEGQVVEVKNKGSRWHLATVLGCQGLRKVRVRWSADSSIEDVEIAHTRSAPRLGIYGSLAGRLGAQVRVLTALEGSVRGTIATLLEAYTKFGGTCLSSLELPIKPATMWKLETIPILRHLLQATGCMALELFLHPHGGGDSPSVLLAGNREQRWQAGQILAAFAAGMDNRKLQGLPSCLAGECRMLAVPKAMMPEFLGKAMSNLVKLMENTDTFIFPMREQAKQEDMDELLNTMFEGQKQKQATNDVAVFGRPLARLAVEVRVMVQIEAKFPGYYSSEGAGQPEMVDPAEGLGVDRVWLSEALDDPESPYKLSEIISSAAECDVHSQGKLVLLAGGRNARIRGRDYLRFSTARRFNRRLHVPDLDRRRDAVSLQVPQEVSQNKWLLQQWDRLGMNSKTVIFYDGPQSEGTWDKLVVMGAVLEKRGKTVGSTLQQARNLQEKALLWTRNGWDLSDEKGVTPGELPEAKEDEEGYQASQGKDGKGGKGKDGKDKDGKGKDGKGKDPFLGKGKGDAQPMDEEDQIVVSGKGGGKEYPSGGKGKEKGKGKNWSFQVDVERQERDKDSRAKGRGKGKKGKFKNKGQEPEPVFEAAPVEAAPVEAAPPPDYGPHGLAAPATPAPLRVQRPAGAAPPVAARVAPPVAESSVAAPQTPAVGALKTLVPAPATPKVQRPAGAAPPVAAAVAPPVAESSVAAPQTPAVSALKSSIPAPATPAPPVGALGGSVPAPATPAPQRQRLAGVAPPVAARVASPVAESSVAAPQTPAVRKGLVPAPATPRVPAAVAPPVEALKGAIPAPATPAAPRGQRLAGVAPPLAAAVAPPASESSAASPQTPAVSADPRNMPALKGLVPAPATPAFGNFGGSVGGGVVPEGARRFSAPPSGERPAPSAADPDLPDNVVPMTPARPGSNAVPQTPAFPFKGGVHDASLPPSPPQTGGYRHSPSTPGAITRTTSAGRFGSVAPATPAAITRSGPYSAAPATPAAITGRSLHGAPATPAAITGSSRMAPATPAAIAGRP